MLSAKCWKETSRRAQPQRAFPFQHGRRRRFHPHPRIAPCQTTQPSPPPPENLPGRGGRKLGHHYSCRSRTPRTRFSLADPVRAGEGLAAPKLSASHRQGFPCAPLCPLWFKLSPFAATPFSVTSDCPFPETAIVKGDGASPVSTGGSWYEPGLARNVIV